jgi:hypothetical protein
MNEIAISMTQLSKRHHYLPEFYLKGFTNVEGRFKIYDVVSKRFLKNGKEFYPHSFFFEQDGNTVTVGERSYDFLERMYGRTDTLIGKILSTIRNSSAEENFGISEKEIPALQFFVSMLFWRLPTNFDQVKGIIKSNDLHNLGLFIKSKLTNEIVRDVDLESRIKNDPNFFKFYKHILPYVTYRRLLECKKKLRIERLNIPLPAICSDNPLIFETEFPDLYYDDFVMPLTGSHIFFRGKELAENAMHNIKIELDAMVFLQARKYVSCTDERYPELLERFYRTNYNNVGQLKEKIFSTLIRIR